MKVKILHTFHDKADYRMVYLVGETITFDDARAESLIGLGLVEKEEESVEVPEDKPLFPEDKPVKTVTTRRRSTSKES